MSRGIRESDWKLFRQLHSIARDRYCEAVLAEATRIASDPTKSAHQRYLELFKLMREKDRQLADAFDNPRRGPARLQLSIIHSLGLLTAEEIGRFSAEAHELLTLHKRI